MRYLIVNADDLGASPGITRGILEAHERGIVTSASLMVDTAWSAEAAARARTVAALSVGLHVTIEDGADARDELRRQHDRFVRLMGRAPSHLDSHHNVHRDPPRRECFLEFSHLAQLPLRGHSPARYVPDFYGRWGGASHPEHLSVENLLGMLERELADGITELGCHPGYADPRQASDYTTEREVELETLCDPRLRAWLGAHEVALVNFDDLGRLAPAAVGR